MLALCSMLLPCYFAQNNASTTAAYYLFHYLFHISLTLISFNGTYEPNAVYSSLC